MELNELAVELGKHDARIRTIEKKQENIDSMVQAMASLQTEQKYIKNDVGEIKTAVNALKDKPGQMWDTVIKCIITALVGFGVGLITRLL